MDGHSREIELKFELDAAAAARIRALPALKGRAARTRELVSTYYDTEDRDLRRAGLSLRVRSDGRARVQTVKAAVAGGLICRGEWEAPLQDEALDLGAAAGTPLEAMLVRDGFREALRPLFATRIRRSTGKVAWDGNSIELSLDDGEVEGDGRRADIRELELELKAGDPAALFDLAEELSREAPLRLSFESKAARGYALVDGDRAERFAEAPPIRRKDTAGEAFQAIGRHCLIQISVNERVLRQVRAPEAVHQLRVGLRRLRSAITAFGPMLKDDRRDRLVEEMKWLAGQLDEARDLDVFARGSFRAAAGRTSNREAMAALGALILDMKDAAYGRALEAVSSPRYLALLIDLARWMEAGPWAGAQEPLFRDMRERRVRAAAADALDRRLKSVRKQGDRLFRLDVHGRHQLRIEAKKLRYSAEFFRRVYDETEEDRFIAALRGLQEVLGDLNDIEAGRSFCAGVAKGADASAAYAAGEVAGLLAAGEAGLLKAAGKSYARFRKAEPFW